MATAVGLSNLVLAPHPDDETFGCGGTLAHLASRGAHVDVAFMTRGEMGFETQGQANPSSQQNLGEQRIREARVACGLLGVSEPLFLDGQDSRLAQQPELIQQIINLLHKGKYQRIFCPWPGDSHIDHVATYQLMRQAVVSSQWVGDVWLYEIWSPLRPNLVLPIDKTIGHKLAAAGAYQSQLSVLDYRTAFQGLASYRSLFCAPAQFAEAFFTCDSTSLPEGA